MRFTRLHAGRAGSGRTAIAVVVLAVVAVAGCGGSGGHAPQAGAAAKAGKDQVSAGRIVFRRYLDDEQTHGALFTVNPDGSGEVQITRPPVGVIDDQPDWSPDGKRIAFERCDTGQSCRVFTVAADGSDEREVTARCELSRVCRLSAPAWTPDGRLVASLADGRDRLESPTGDLLWPESSKIVLIDLDRHTQRTLVRRDHWTGQVVTPAISPDGHTVLYALRIPPRPAAERAALFVVDIDGTHNHRITPWALGRGDHPDFAPDGTILFTSYQEIDGKQSDFWTVDSDGTGLRQLTHVKAGTIVLSASHSADGKWIVYGASGVAGDADVFVMRADGTGARPVTRTKQWDSAPDWGPPGP